MVDLESCPCCGCKGIYKLDRHDELIGKVPQIFCNGCKLTVEVENDSPYLDDSITYSYLREKLTRTWNRRVKR